MMNTRKLAHISVLITFALVIHTVEAIVPMPLLVPGAKIGLANIITLLTFIIYGFKSAIFVAVIRTVLGSIFLGNFLGFGFFLSFSGAVISTLAMALGIYLWRRDKVSLIAVSILGAVAHNTAQVAAASIIIRNINLLKLYLPLLLILAIPTGFFTGLVVIYSQKALSGVIGQLQES
ncbi:MAG: Gx transporter family protein [Clostridiales bacterium]|nr:Gx transporter family protein [Clostridiales bacterium]